jgi:hypothetical protein
MLWYVHFYYKRSARIESPRGYNYISSKCYCENIVAFKFHSCFSNMFLILLLLISRENSLFGMSRGENYAIWEKHIDSKYFYPRGKPVSK